VNGDGQRPEDRRHDHVVRDAGCHEPERVGESRRRAQDREQNDKGHGIDEAQERGGNDRDDRTKAMQGATDRDGQCDRHEQGECRGPERTLRERVEGQTPDERPDEAAVEPDGDGPDDRHDEDEMRLGIAHPEIWRDGRFDDGGHRRCDRRDEQSHVTIRSSASRSRLDRAGRLTIGGGGDVQHQYPMPARDPAMARSSLGAEGSESQFERERGRRARFHVKPWPRSAARGERQGETRLGRAQSPGERLARPSGARRFEGRKGPGC